MAEKKNISEEKIKAEEQAELDEVRVSEPAVDLPGDAVDTTKTGEGEAEELESEDETDNDSDETPELDESGNRVTKAGKRSAKSQREADAEVARLEAKDSGANDADDEPKAPKRQMPNPLHQHGKKYRDAISKVDRLKSYELAEALDLARETSTTKFDSSIEIHIGLGVDPRQADQMVRASVVLPHGTGRTIRVAVIAPEAKHAEATAAGADLVGEADLLKEIESGKLNFDLLVATPDMMARLGKVAKILGPRGLMPNPKSGTVTPNVAEAVKQAKAGKVEFRIDKQAIVHQAVGKTSFEAANLLENATTFISAIMTAKPSVAKGTYVKSMSVTSTMGPGIKVDVTKAIAAAAAAKK